MKTTVRTLVLALALLWPVVACAQATHVTTGSSLPAACRVGDLYYKTGSGAGVYACSATNTWSAERTLAFTLDVQAAICDDGAGWSNWDFQTHATSSPTYACVAGTSNGPVGVLNYDDAAVEYAWNKFFLPSDWTGAIDLRLLWSTAATTGNVVWQIQTACIADNESVDAAWNTAQTITDAAKGSANLVNVATLTSVTTTGCAAGELFKYRLLRDPAHASDTIAATASLLEVEWTYRRAQ